MVSTPAGLFELTITSIMKSSISNTFRAEQESFHSPENK